jgi:hypothetical protein
MRAQLYAAACRATIKYVDRLPHATFSNRDRVILFLEWLMMFRRFRLVAAFAAAPTLFLAVSADAAMMNHGDFVGETVTFSAVTENNLEATLFYEDFGVSDDTLIFDPEGFGVQVNPGAGSSLLDSKLEMIITAHDGYAISTVEFGEAGDLSLVGDAQVSAGLPFFWKILEVDGVSISPILGDGQESFSATMNGTGQLWELSFNIDFAQELTLAEMTLGELGTNVTKIDLIFDNSLTATANNASSVAFIKKKQTAGVTVGTTEYVPEPSSALTLALALMGLVVRRRK